MVSACNMSKRRQTVSWKWTNATKILSHAISLFGVLSIVHLHHFKQTYKLLNKIQTYQGSLYVSDYFAKFPMSIAIFMEQVTF